MTIWALVPAKSLRAGKSRLAPVLSDAARASLNRSFLNRTLEVVTSHPAIQRTIVVSPDPSALEMATGRGAVPLREREPIGLNHALDLARGAALADGAEAILTVSMDLPWLTRADLDAVLAAAGDPPGVVIAPDQARLGTNVLYQEPGDCLRFRYGEGSFAAHRSEARDRGLDCAVVLRTGLSFDVDLPADLARLDRAGEANGLESGPRSRDGPETIEIHAGESR